jgi:hypothetical protein
LITSLTRGRTQGSDFGEESYDQLKLSDIPRYGFLTLK